MRAVSDSKPHSHSHTPEKPDAKSGPAIAGRAGLALIVYLFLSSVNLPNVVGRPRIEAEASTNVTLVDTVSVAAAVPPIAGRPVTEVIAEVGGVGFRWQRQEELSETVASDRHAGKYFLAGLPILAPEVEVPISVPVPTVVDQPGASATAALDRAGFKSQRQEVPSETTPPGRVIGTSPPAGALVDKGSTVIVIVAVPVRVLVPRVVGQRVGDATAALGRVGLKWLRREQSNERVTPGTVISALPVAGQSVEKGTSVTLVIAKAVYRDSVIKTPPLPPDGIRTVAPSTAGPPPTASNTGNVAPRMPSLVGPSSGAETVVPSASAAPPAPATLSGDALIGHLYDNAHQ
jgi:PASTA domain-containing protein